jgi:hypothetical protein
MAFLDFLQDLPIPILLIATIAIALVVGWVIAGLVRLGVRVSGRDPAKPIFIPELVTVTSILFALILSFSAAGVWNDWLRAESAVQREALALDNVLALADGLAPDRSGRIREQVVAYAKAAAKHEWPAMSRQADLEDAAFNVSDRILAKLTAEVSRDALRPDASPVSAMLMPQIFEARSARLARLTMSHSAVSGAQWFALIALIVSTLVVVALIYNYHRGTQILAISLFSVASAVAFFVILAHDRPFVGVISVSPKPLLQLATRTSPEIPVAAETKPGVK